MLTNQLYFDYFSESTYSGGDKCVGFYARHRACAL